ncbi:hypothetical protein FRC09_002561 [Ceratobasidium sp. 395]|nr:hypothetical protein FRC09_002561 [Ceratobasidium sp. 395]
MSSDWVDPSDDWSNVKDDFGQFLKDCDPDKWDNLPPLDLDDAPPTTADILNLAGLHRGNKVGAGFAQALQNVGGGNSVVARQYAETAQKIMDLESELEDIFLPVVVKRRQRINYRWCSFMAWRAPRMPANDYWLESTVAEHSEVFLFVMVDLTPGHSGEDGKTLRASTVYEWARTFMWLVDAKCVDKNGALVGRKLLNNGLRQKIQSRVVWFAHHRGLERHAKHQLFVGRPQLLLFLRHGFQQTQTYGRRSFQQTVVSMIFLQQMGARIGSLGYSTLLHKKRGQYITLGDLALGRTGYCRWRVRVTLKHRKGHNMTADAGQVVIFELDPVTKIHNLWFDAGLHVVSLLHMRGAIQGHKTLQSIFESTSAELVIEPSMRKQPLFLERTARGLDIDLIDFEPASAKGMNVTIQTLGQPVGVEITSHAFRRETGNRIALIMGSEAAQTALTHEEDQSTMNRHYTHNTLNIPMTALVLGDLDAVASAANKMALTRHSISDNVVQAMVAGVDYFTVDKLSDKEMETVQADARLVEKDAQLTACWEQFYGFLPKDAQVTHGQREPERIKAIFEKYSDSDEYGANEESLKHLRTRIHKLSKERTEIFRAVKRPFIARKRKEAFNNSKLAPRTTEQENQARKELSDLVESPDNLPDLELEPLSLSIEAIKAGRFKAGFLTDAALKELNDPTLIERLQVEQTTDQEVADELDDERTMEGQSGDGVELQEGLATFTDKNEMQVINADVAETVKSFMIAMNQPLVHTAILEALKEKNDGLYACSVCNALTSTVGAGRYRKAKLKQANFKTRARLSRHEDSHSQWLKLCPFMVTENKPLEWKCPLAKCDKRFPSLEEVQEHCVTECEGHEVFQALKLQHDTRSRGIGSGPRTSLKTRKFAQELTRGMDLGKDEMARLDWWRTLDLDKIDELSQKYDLDPAVLADAMPSMVAAMEEMLSLVGPDGVLRLERPDLSYDKIVEAVLTDEVLSEVNAFIYGEEVDQAMAEQHGHA